MWSRLEKGLCGVRLEKGLCGVRLENRIMWSKTGEQDHVE